jgi:hypothetical protein
MTFTAVASNLALGYGAGSNLTGGSSNIYVGSPGPGVLSAESTTMRLGQSQTRAFIAGIYNTSLIGGLKPVYINSAGQLGTVASSARYKRDIQSMGAQSEKLQQLRPVTFRYKQDPQGEQQYGLIAEEVAKVYPELVVRGAKGEVESVQYHELIPMLLNEVQRQEQALGGVQARQLTTQAQELAELKAEMALLRQQH